MKLDSRLMTPAGGILALLCFFLPWIKVDCSIKTWGQKLNSEIIFISGFELATKQQVNLITVALIMTLVIVVVSLYMLKEQTPWKSKRTIFISSGIGLGCLLFEYIHLNTGMDTPIGKVTLEDLEAILQIGAFGTTIGFILAIVGVWKYSNSGDG